MLKNKVHLKTFAGIILISAILGFVYNTISPDGIKLIREKKEYNYADSGISLNGSNEIKLISGDDAYDLFRGNIAQFLDARDQWEFADGHIKNAVNIPEYMFEDLESEVLQMDKNKLYVIYCGGDDCDISKRLAEKFKVLGFKNLLVYEKGWSEWQKRNYPTETSKVK